MPVSKEFQEGEADLRHTLIVVAEDGKVYKLTREVWETDSNLVTSAAGKGVVNQLTEFGTYLAFIPPDIAVGIGHFCTVVNLQAILKNNPETSDAKK